MKLDTEKVIEKYKDRIFAIGLSILKNPDDAEDVVQETFLKYHTYKKILNLKNIFNLGYIKQLLIKQKIFKESFGEENKYRQKTIWLLFLLIYHRMKNYFKQ